jgi:putative glycosyl hydrolase-like family 15 (GHL15) protein
VNWQNEYRTAEDWLSHLSRAEQTQAMGKEMISVAQGLRDDSERQEFAYASYLLVTNGLASFRYANFDHYDQVWLYDNYRFDLGAPLGERYLHGTLWRRDFERGYVTVDPVYHTASIDLTAAARELPNAVPQRNVLATALPVLTWNEITWATRYSVQVDTDPAFTGSQIVDMVISARHLSLGALANGEYFWRVRAKRPDGTWSLWSSVDTFTISVP